VLGLLDLYEATGNTEHVLFAREIQQRQDDLFWDSEAGAYFASPEGDSSVLVSVFFGTEETRSSMGYDRSA
jgi:uncharacterized protein YyaL (SSP411 family)